MVGCNPRPMCLFYDLLLQIQPLILAHLYSVRVRPYARDGDPYFARRRNGGHYTRYKMKNERSPFLPSSVQRRNRRREDMDRRKIQLQNLAAKAAEMGGGIGAEGQSEMRAFSLKEVGFAYKKMV